MSLLDELTVVPTHYPVEQIVYDQDDNFETGRRTIACGCDEKFGWIFGEGIHV